MSSIINSSPPNEKVPSTSDWLNDLTYSDDENDSIWDLLEKNNISPEGQEPPASLNYLFPPQDQLFHPLARGESYFSAISDEGSHLAYSVLSIPGEEERVNTSYGSIEDSFKKPGFRHAPSLVDRKQHMPIQQALPKPEVSTTNDKNINQYRILSPLPTHHEETPLTSATATDVTISPATEGEHQRIRSILELEARQKLRKQKRLKRIKKAARAREAEVDRVRGVDQTNGKQHDAIFGWIFVVQFVMVTMGALILGPGALSADMLKKMEVKDDYNPFAGLQSDDIVIISSLPAPSFIDEVEGFDASDAKTISHIDYLNIIELVAIASGFASLCSLLALGFMMMLSKNIFHIMLVFTVVASMIFTILSVMIGHGWIVPIIGTTALVSSFIYTSVVWDRIPFAATNLKVALKSMKSNIDVPLVGVSALSMSFIWTIWCTYSFIGVFDFLSDNEQLSDKWMVVVVGFYLFSYWWTIQVIKGISQATVAGIISHWWNNQESLRACSSTLRSSLHRNLTQSFGSICIGALVLDQCVLFHRICNFFWLARPNINNSRSISTTREVSEKSPKNIPCLLDDNVVYRNVNQWSYTYIGLYGYKFWDSGGKASQLFEARGWTDVVSDDLILTALTMSNMVIGVSTAFLGLIVEEVDEISLTTLHRPLATAFIVSLFVGLVLSSTFLSIVEGSVNTILVCYASSPADFHANHPSLSAELKSVWKEFWLPT